MDLQQQKNLLQEILDTMGESLVVLSPGLDIVMVNEKPQVPLPPGEWHNGNNALDLYANSPELSAGGADLHDNCTSQNQHVIASLRARKSFRILRSVFLSKLLVCKKESF